MNIFKNKKALAVLGGAGLLASVLTGCTSAADRSAENLGVKAENFEVQREIIGTNTRTGEALFHYTGRCSIESGSGASDMAGYLQIMCKHGPDDYRKHFEREATDTHISTNQLDPVNVDEYRTDIRIMPEQVVPQITVQTGERP